MTTLLLVRHGETDWNAERRWQGHADVPLNERGRKQAQRLADSFPGDAVDAIYASDLARARETAEILGARLGRLIRMTEPDTPYAIRTAAGVRAMASEPGPVEAGEHEVTASIQVTFALEGG